MTTLQALEQYCGTTCLEEILSHLDVILYGRFIDHIGNIEERYGVTHSELLKFEQEN